MKQRVAILAILFAASTPRDVNADYDPPLFEEIARQSTAIVDATVVELTNEGQAKLEVHRYLKGEKAPATLTGIWLTCQAELPDILEAPNRYVLCLRGDQLLEEATYYQIREHDGRLECHYYDSRSDEAEWMAMTVFADKLVFATEETNSEVPLPRNAHETVEVFLKALQAGELEEAASFCVGKISDEEIGRLKEQLPSEKLVVYYASASRSAENQQASSVSTTLNGVQLAPEEIQSPKLLFRLVKTKEQWTISSVEFKAITAVAAYEAYARFQAEFPDARLVRPRIGEGEDILVFTSRDYSLTQLAAQHENSGGTIEEDLQHISRPWTVSKILEHYAGETNLEMRTELLRLLAWSRDPRGTVVVGEALNDKLVFEPFAADLLLDTHHMPIEAYVGGTEQHIEAAHNWWGENQARLRAEAAELAFPSTSDTTAELIEYLKGPAPDNDFVSAQTRAGAIDILGERKANEAIPYLIDCLADGRALTGSDNWVGGAAANALSVITGRPFSIDQNECREWWQQRAKDE